ncbi:bifunctional 4-hydroxy-2-oxoglutarate aldolase/2-dehydro-3-deoxy-phosphogluconate aldolase [Legionella impletisoli]|uniref:2-dehydro-3-deoxy-phosphogluconate aldolase n=1 Tax=Legionella impletisoli TaxID=343510 RepID=A0A917N7N1_9GAMM|nr:bifunctional 4-hydroxy-2-oxoglutarate aldolase/2-dehydro-3-deoxy-phosphogluconate aldolase [Legionella impletisoli]GGI75466.1 ketohydroxyglutarate aldolase [Legionella impletisoli]
MNTIQQTQWPLQPSDLFKFGPVIPVIVINDLAEALPLAKSLLAKGIKVLEITLRTPVALEAIQLIRREVPEAVTGAGTVLNAGQLKKAEQAGAQFALSPGLTPDLLLAGKKGNIPFIPGISSVSELMIGLEYGYTHFKFFPAEAKGGVPALKAFYGPFPDVRFCPTGGINEENYRTYLDLPNVDCVGGSWLI